MRLKMTNPLNLSMNKIKMCMGLLPQDGWTSGETAFMYQVVDPGPLLMSYDSRSCGFFECFFSGFSLLAVIEFSKNGGFF